MTIIGLLCLGSGIGMIAGAFYWYRAGYMDGWHDGREYVHSIFDLGEAGNGPCS